MIYVANKNNVLNGVLHYAGAEIEADEQPSGNWDLKPGQEEPEQAATAGDMTVAQLKEQAAARGIEVPSKATKAEILKLLE